MTYEEPGRAHGTGRCVLTQHTQSPCSIFLTSHLLTPFPGLPATRSICSSPSSHLDAVVQLPGCSAAVKRFYSRAGADHPGKVSGPRGWWYKANHDRLGLSTDGAICGPCSKKAHQNLLPLSTNSANAVFYDKQKPMGKTDQQLRMKNDLSTAERLVKELDKLHNGNFS